MRRSSNGFSAVVLIGILDEMKSVGSAITGGSVKMSIEHPVDS
jgi:hypothetical protein